MDGNRPLAEQVVVITGASSGLGRRMAHAVSAAGASVVVAARRVERLKDLADDLPSATAVACDVSVDEDRVRLIDTALDRYGRLDGLVNNAGISAPGPASRETVETFRRQLEINLVAPFALAGLAARAMRANPGGGRSIVNIGSIMGLRSTAPMPEAGYVASKAGLHGLTRELASQWGRHGIRVNALAPGFFPSEMTDGLVSGDGSAPDWITQGTALGRLGRPEDLDGALVFLLSASFVTGHTLVVDGGFTTR
ncbi:SDR family NAD(P)-dependent oxidoreductase [Amycolatopsis jejuensis]|uniref:SDR family NAD(P)-dependent oxidoreductase n=1 Tax=Amycolatopsis jejuensis TaxID=330084 RepID=UPI000527DCDE|nr:SDR family oxidoreductase [Amycolatopsis jejuensis]